MSKSHEIMLRMGALLVLPSLLIAPVALAGDPSADPPSVTVHYEDLNLNNPQGIAALDRRIRSAALQVCQPQEGPQLENRVFWSAWRDCLDQAMTHAVQTVHDDRLSAYHWEHTHGSKQAAMAASVVAAKQ